MNITIRRATSDDTSIIQKFNEQLFHEEYERGHDKDLDLSWPGKRKGKDYYKKAVTKKEYITLIAHSHRIPVGYLIGSIKNKFSYRDVYTSELENMFVVQAQRRKGIGQRLVKEYIKTAKSHGVERIYVSTYVKNHIAVFFYQACGFYPWSAGLELKA